MSYPNVPLGKNEQDRRVAQALNSLLNELDYVGSHINDGPPDAGEEVLHELRTFPVSIVKSSCYAVAETAGTTADAVFALTIDGEDAGTVTFPPGETEGVFDITLTDIPALTPLKITAPDPANAALDDITIIIALKH